MRSARVTVVAFATRRNPIAGTANIGSADHGSRVRCAGTILKPRRAAPALLPLLVVALAAADAQAGSAGEATDPRLMLRFVEDGAVVRRLWAEGGLSWERVTGGTDLQFRPNVAFRYGRDVEAGLVAPVLRRTRSGSSMLYGSEVDESLSSTGLGDLVLYGKYRVLRSPFELSVGATCSLPLAHGDSGLTSGAVQGSGFAGLRKRFSSLTLAGHVGFAVTEEARFGQGAEGRLSATAGLGVLVPLAPMWVLLTELDYAGAQFEGDGAYSRVLLGLDWRPMSNMAVRGGVGTGLTDAAPEAIGLASLVFDL